MAEEAKLKETISQKEATRIANYEIQNTYTGKERPRKLGLDKERIAKARKLLADRASLDKKAEELRRGEDESYTKMYDRIRKARKEKRKEIYVSGETPLKLSEIYQVTDTGKRIPANKVPLLDTEIIKYDKDGNKLRDKKGHIIKEKVKGKDGSKIVAYEVASDKIIQMGNTASITVSNVKRPYLVVTKQKIKRKKVGNKLLFTREGNYFVTKTHIDLLFKKAQEKHGENAPIFLNNIAVERQQFIQVKGGWAISPSALAEINAPEYEGTISVRYSLIYRKSLISLQTRGEFGKAEKAEKALYGEIKTSISLPGGTVQNVTILIRSKDAYSAIKQMGAANKKSGVALFCVVATDFTASKKGNDGDNRAWGYIKGRQCFVHIKRDGNGQQWRCHRQIQGFRPLSHNKLHKRLLRDIGQVIGNGVWGSDKRYRRDYT